MSELLKKENGYAHFKVGVTADEFKVAVDEAYKKMKHLFNVPGFRKGKVPKKIVERNYGVEVFFEDALNICLPAKVEEAIKSLELDAIDQAEVVNLPEVQLETPFEVDFKVAIVPEVKLGNIESFELEKIEYEVTEELIDGEVKKEIEMQGRVVNLDSDAVAEDGDTVKIDFKGFVDGEAFEGGESKDFDLKLGSHTFIDNYEEQIVGHKVGDEFEVAVKFPEDYAENLAGKDAKFEVSLKGISRIEYPEFDDEFVKDVSEFNTVDEYKADIRNRLEKEFAKRVEIETESALVEKLVESMEVAIPEVMIKAQVEDEIREFARNISNYGLDFNEYMKATNQTADKLIEQFTPTAEKKVKARLAVDAAAEALNISVDDAEIAAEIDKIVEESKVDEKEKAKHRERLEELAKEEIKRNKIREKALAELTKRVNFVEKKEESAK